MSRDPLQSLLRLRQSAVDEARKEVAGAYRLEHEAIAAVQLATETLELEMRSASSLAAGDETVEAFARWLPVGRKTIADAHAKQRDATAALDRVRTVLQLARAAVAAVETLIQQRAEIKEQMFRHREQSALDEFATRRRGRYP